MRSDPSKAKATAIRRGWVFAGIATLALTVGGVALLPGQSATTAKPALATVNPTQASRQLAQSSVNPVQTETQSTQVTANSGAGGDAQAQPVAQEAADLLKMATDLQAELNKTRVATLSLAVVRKASEIEQLAKKMRNQP